MPKSLLSRSVESAVVGRCLIASSLSRHGGTSMSAARWHELMPMGFSKSSGRISPG
jgi:hypothetical protein